METILGPFWHEGKLIEFSIKSGEFYLTVGTPDAKTSDEIECVVYKNLKAGMQWKGVLDPDNPSLGEMQVIFKSNQLFVKEITSSKKGSGQVSRSYCIDVQGNRTRISREQFNVIRDGDGHWYKSKQAQPIQLGRDVSGAYLFNSRLAHLRITQVSLADYVNVLTFILYPDSTYIEHINADVIDFHLLIECSDVVTRRAMYDAVFDELTTIAPDIKFLSPLVEDATINGALSESKKSKSIKDIVLNAYLLRRAYITRDICMMSLDECTRLEKLLKVLKSGSSIQILAIKRFSGADLTEAFMAHTKLEIENRRKQFKEQRRLDKLSGKAKPQPNALDCVKDSIVPVYANLYEQKAYALRSAHLLAELQQMPSYLFEQQPVDVMCQWLNILLNERYPGTNMSHNASYDNEVFLSTLLKFTEHDRFDELPLSAKILLTEFLGECELCIPDKEFLTRKADFLSRQEIEFYYKAEMQPIEYGILCQWLVFLDEDSIARLYSEESNVLGSDESLLQTTLNSEFLMNVVIRDKQLLSYFKATIDTKSLLKHASVACYVAETPSMWKELGITKQYLIDLAHKDGYSDLAVKLLDLKIIPEGKQRRFHRRTDSQNSLAATHPELASELLARPEVNVRDGDIAQWYQCLDQKYDIADPAYQAFLLEVLKHYGIGPQQIAESFAQTILTLVKYAVAAQNINLAMKLSAVKALPEDHRVLLDDINFSGRGVVLVQ